MTAMGKDNRENNATRSSLVHVFTQPPPTAAVCRAEPKRRLAVTRSRPGVALISAVHHQNFPAATPRTPANAFDRPVWLDPGFPPPYGISYRGVKLPRVSAGFGRLGLRRGADLPQVGNPAIRTS